MEKFLHSALILLILFSSIYSSHAQTDRLKVYNVEDISKNNQVEESYPNIPEKKNTTKLKQAINKDVSYLRFSENVWDSISRIKVAAEISNSNEQTDIQSNNTNKNIKNNSTDFDNVTYNKETIKDNQSISTSEISPTKVTRSVNYKTSNLKEDVQPVINYTTTSITPNKRIYLQQEADDLQIEIKQNENNPNYNLVEKQKLLDYIKTLLKN